MDFRSKVEGAFGAEFGGAKCARLSRFLELVYEWNRHTNITAVPAEDAVARHLIDSLAIRSLVELEALQSIIDVGSGAGLPGLPLAMVAPDSHVVLVESKGRKAAFLERAVRELKLENVVVLQARAEELGRASEHRESYELAVARGVGNLSLSLELTLPLVARSGQVILWKGIEYQSEQADAEGLLGELGGKIEAVESLKLANAPDRYLISARKIGMTARRLPRTGASLGVNL